MPRNDSVHPAYRYVASHIAADDVAAIRSAYQHIAPQLGPSASLSGVTEALFLLAATAPRRWLSAVPRSGTSVRSSGDSTYGADRVYLGVLWSRDAVDLATRLTADRTEALATAGTEAGVKPHRVTRAAVIGTGVRWAGERLVSDLHAAELGNRAAQRRVNAALKSMRPRYETGPGG